MRRGSARPPESFTPAPSPAAATAFVGDYELLEEIARGGMGIVYRAKQISLNRIVAVKLITSGRLASESELRRFRLEAEAAANLDHPNIVPIYEVGEHEGRHYFSMRLVEGPSLAQALHAGTLATSTPSPSRPGQPGAAPENISPAQSARLIAIVARAIHFAHQRGILHRDLKPSNILLDRQGQPHITDFGLAKRLTPDPSSSRLTLSSDAVGTPSYMAPEQAAGKTRETTIAVDVYSLGAVLYEALAGCPPFVAPTPLETMRQVVEDEPVPPSVVLRQRSEATGGGAGRASSRGLWVDRELETICLKCLEKSPASRYGSAEALAQDLERWLQGEPIQARPSGVWARARKWVRRKPGLAALAAALVVTVTIGFSAVLWQWRQTNRAQQKAVVNLDKAIEAVLTFLTEVADEPRLEQADLFAFRQGLLETAVPFLEGFGRERAGDVRLLAQRGLAYLSLTKPLASLGRTSEAYTNAVLARGTFLLLTRQAPRQQEFWRARMQTEQTLAGLLQQAGRFEEAGTVFRESIEAHRVRLKDASNASLEQRALAQLYASYGLLLSESTRPTEADAAERQARAILEKLVQTNPGSRGLQEDLAGVLQSHGICLSRYAGHDQEAEAAYREALRIRQGIGADNRDRPAFRYDLGGAWLNLGTQVSNTPSRRDEAEQCWGEALKVFESLAADLPSVPSYRHKLAITYDHLGRVYADTGRWPKAEEAYNKAFGLLGPLVTNYPYTPAFRSTLADNCRHAGTRYAAAHQTNRAVALLEQSVSLFTQLASADPAIPTHRLKLVDASADLAAIRQAAGQFPLAELMYSNAVAQAGQLVAMRAAFVDFRGNLGAEEGRYGQFLASQTGRERDAENHFRVAVVVREALLRSSNNSAYLRWRLADNYSDLGLLFLRTNRLEEAETMLTKAVGALEPLVQEVPGSEDYQWSLARSYEHLAVLRYNTRRFEDCLNYLEKALTMQTALGNAFPQNGRYARDAQGLRTRIDRVRTKIPAK